MAASELTARSLLMPFLVVPLGVITSFARVSGGLFVDLSKIPFPYIVSVTSFLASSCENYISNDALIIASAKNMKYAGPPADIPVVTSIIRLALTIDTFPKQPITVYSGPFRSLILV